MLTEVHDLQLNGTPQEADAFVEKYSAWNDKMQYIVDRIRDLHPRLYRVLYQPLAMRLLEQNTLK
jgi:hypothetical protein